VSAETVPAETIAARVPSRRIWLRLYEVGVVAPLLLWIAFEAYQHPSSFEDPLLLEWVVAIAVVDVLPVPTSMGLPFSLSFPLELSVALIYPPPVAAAVAFLGSTDIRELKRAIPLGTAAWNRGQIAWSVVLEGLIFHRLASLGSPWYVLGPVVMLSGAAGYAANVLLVGFYVHLKSGEPVGVLLREMHVGVFGEFIAAYLGLALFSTVVATTFVEAGPWSVAVFIAPLALARQMFMRTHSLHEATLELEAKRQENEYQALHDSLTGLPNRTLFLRDLQEAVDARAEGERLAVMIMDLDHFKEINDTLGHHVGDRVLQEIGPRLAGVLREGDLMARLGGDEFGILLPDVPDDRVAIRIAERLMEELEQPLAVDGLALSVSGSVGIAIYPSHSDGVETLLRRADVAMYAAKEAGGGFEVYSPTLDENSPDRLTLVSQVRPGLERREFVLHYQPKVSLSDGRATGVEALIRWQHPDRGLVYPDDFIPLVEHTVLLRPLTSYVIEMALQQWRAWARCGLELEVAVNISARSLLDLQLPTHIAELLLRWEVPCRFLTLELTESFLMADPGRSVGVLAELADVGVRLSIDDFGTGYSSLSHLKRLPIHEIKVDRSFVSNMQGDPNDEMIVRATIELGRNLGLQVVAEGVEDQATLEQLGAFSCDLAQGYHIAMPMPAAQATRWLELHAPRHRGEDTDDGGYPRLRVV
jgi:diguanylate cyclase (GGDEF)-like protein